MNVAAALAGVGVVGIAIGFAAQAERRRATYFEVMEKCKNALDEAGIEIPFPHLQLLVDNVDQRVWEQASAWAKADREAA